MGPTSLGGAVALRTLERCGVYQVSGSFLGRMARRVFSSDKYELITARKSPGLISIMCVGAQ